MRRRRGLAGRARQSDVLEQGQGIAIGAAVLSITAYMVQLESRVNTLEVRGSPHLAEINNRLTVTEKETEANNDRIERITEIMTRQLNVKP